MTASPDFSDYLELIATQYAQWWTIDALTETIAARQATFTFEQRVQTEEPCKEAPNRKEKISLPLFQGVHEYAKKEHVLLVGSPGIGKSTVLLRLLVDFARQELKKPIPRIPVLIRLKRYEKPASGSEDRSGMLALIQDTLEPNLSLEISEIKTLLFQEKRLILLLDGLNEMPADTALTELTAFRDKCDRAGISLICTTRESGDTLGIKRRLEIQSLMPQGEIQRFLNECMPSKKQEVLQLLNRDNRELSCTPFVLWMLYDSFQQTGDVAKTMGEAFQKFFQSFNGCREDAPVSSERRRQWNQWLEHLGFSMLSSLDPHDPGLVISEEQAEKILTEKFGTESPSRINELMKHHLLQKVSHKKIGFHHQLIQEYYAAEWLASEVEQHPEWLEKMPNQPYARFQWQYLNYLKWREAIALMLALVEDEGQAVRVVELAIGVDLRLGARLAGDVRGNSQKRTVGWIEDFSTPEFPELFKVELLSITNSVEALPSLLQTVQSLDFSVRWSSATALGKVNAPDSVQALLIASKDSSPFVCLAAVAALGSLGNDAAIKALLEVLENAADYGDIYLGAAYELGKLGNEIGIQCLREALSHPQSSVIRKAIAALHLLNTESSNSALLETLHHSKNYVRELAVRALGKIANDAWVLDLLKVLEHEDFRSPEFIALDESVVYALGQMGSDKAISALVSISEHPRPLVRRKVLETLGNLGCKLAIPTLQKALKDKDIIIREIAVTALGKIGDESAKIGLVQALEDSDAHVRVSVARTLGKMRVKEAAPQLLQMLVDEEQQFRWDISDALGKIGGKVTTAKLLELLKNPSIQIRQIAARTIGLIGNKAVIPELIEALYIEELAVINKANELCSSAIETSELIAEKLEEHEEAVVSLAIALMHLHCCIGVLTLKRKIENLTSYDSLWYYFSFDLSRDLKTKAAIPVLIETLKLQSEEIRHAAAAALGCILRDTENLDTMLLPLICKTLADADKFIYIVVIPLLCKINTEAVVPEILKILNHPHQTIRLKAASALAKLKNESAIPVLLYALEDEDISVQRDAAFALGELGSETVVSIFIDLLRHGSPKARQEIIEALERIGNPKALAVLKELELTLSDYELARAIATIQSRCQFYNYEIFQSKCLPQLDIQTANALPQSDRSNPLTDTKRTILILAASPTDQVRLRLDQEVRDIGESLRRSPQRDCFTLQSRWAVRPIDLRRAILDHNPQIVHFCGHGEGEQGIILEDATGKSQLVLTEAIANLFKLFADEGLECVVLNACYSEVQANAIAQHIPYVIHIV